MNKWVWPPAGRVSSLSLDQCHSRTAFSARLLYGGCKIRRGVVKSGRGWGRDVEEGWVGGQAHLLVNFSLLRHRLQTRKPESSPSTRARLRAPPKIGHNSRKEAGGAAVPGSETQSSDLPSLDQPHPLDLSLKSLLQMAPTRIRGPSLLPTHHINFHIRSPPATLFPE